MIVGFHISGLGSLTEKQLADLIRKHVIMESLTYADNMAKVIAKGYELNILCPNLNDEGVLDNFNVPYEVINIDQSETSESVVIFNAVDFRVELTYKDAENVIVLQPSQYVVIPRRDADEFKEHKKAGLIKVFNGFLSDRYFTDEFSVEFA